MDLEFYNKKVVCITGSSRGIGKAIAILLGKNGAKICLNGRDEKSLIDTYKEFQALNIDCIYLKADVSIDIEAQKLIDRAIDQYGNLDVLINNAGISSRGLIADTNTQAWKKITDINLLGSIFPTLYALPHIIKSKGSIILISSIGAKVGLPGQANYSVTKMGLTAFAQALQIEHKADNIHIGIIYLGFVENEERKQIMLANGDFETIKPWKKSNPVSRENVANAIARTIIKRRNKVTLTLLGKLQKFALKFLPWGINLYLKKDLEDFKKFFK